LQAPAWHESPVLQASLSLHFAPLALAGFEQTPVCALHTPVS
jgi:hypothetical protein